ncbi:cation acetate symporter [Thermobispora bispora]|uniref:SSS sodium solute transporter superfamily n=1 Tax=Thermobispora bispora (strain ATCC 19993 / DSM 43833 / CBS 139.67 / JCM 10125 / KCTC 9307 / NBRC 14880 / R51) TaxID=469371 RepID=D6Y2J1_THEBD|nr:cation acetate symporter [Thermobispora bispora]MBO2473424.1 cation acetate symporter [Actinomycetales bacterium]MDI9581973.1 cation acetate symporter [Thermobispora sp.]ADG88840.1 SSS sodium solute transporter superfamily [Thermobispora bispora DSM 43833]MBX6167191.1 cation acetate symporter [Thermobispora bispora]QSI48601.1 cation acetate symporter [Thermobispora bispora]
MSSHQVLSTILFVLFVAATLAITFWASRNTKSAADFYAGGRSFSGLQNGLAIGGDYMSAASFLGIAGMIALSGYDGFLYSIGFLVAWLVALLLVAELMRNSGKYTMADVLAFRMSPRPVRTAAGVSTITVSIFYLIAQMVGAGALVGLLLGISSEAGKMWTIVGVGLLMIIYVVFGGMKGTTWVQIVKAVFLMAGAGLVTLLVLAKYGFNLSALLGDAAAQSGKGDAFLNPGLKYGTDDQGIWGKIDLISLGLALVLGTAGLPHILIRFYTVPTAQDARKSVMWGIGIIGVFYLFTLVLGFGAAALVGSQTIAEANAAGNTAAPQLAEAVGRDFFGDVGGTVLLAVIAAVAFATILAVVAGLTLASSSSFAHDLYAHVFKRGNITEKEEVNAARIAAFVVGAISIVLGIFAQSLNVAFLVALAFAVAASGNLPAILYSLFWKRFNTAGAVSAIYGGLISAVLLVVFSPVVSGSPSAMFPNVDFAVVPISNPGIFSIPIGFLCGYLGTVLSKEYNAQKFAEIEVRALTGLGAEKASTH